MTSRSIADRALRTIGEHGGVEGLATGMSSTAWTGTVAGTEYVVRVPVGDRQRPTPRYAAEARLLADLSARGAPVAPTRILRIDGNDCAIAERTHGRVLQPDDWNDDVVDAVARFLTTLHATSPALAVEADPIQRFHLATIWPLDGSDLGDHPVADIWPDRRTAIEGRRPAIEAAAAAAPTTVVHTDLHPQHLLIDDNGALAGVLDFGDAFAGPASWDHACLRYYHGPDVQRRVAAAMGLAAASTDEVDAIGISWALYKLAKTPARADVLERVDMMLSQSGC